jgi:tetratricopeptide (TPR) repeat protein
MRSRTILKAAAILALGWALLPALPPALAQEDLRAQAEAAFRSDRYPEAIELYQRILAESPRDTFSLKRLALILSWENRLDESIDAYRSLLRLDPADTEAKRELAKILAWDERFSESERTYRELIAAQPGDGRLRLGLAEILSWQGKNAEAKAIYEDLIEKKSHAIEAAVGMGDVTSWEGDLDGAAMWYRQVLKADPENERARLGLARVHHWQGMTRAAVREIDEAMRRYPESREAKKLHREIHDPLRPAVTPSFERTLDTDGNDLMTSRIAYSRHLDPQTTLDFAATRYEAEFRCEVAAHCPGATVGEPATTEGDLFEALFATRFSDILYFNARLGADRLETFEGDSHSGVVGGWSFDFYPIQSFGAGFGYTRESLIDTARLIASDIRLDAVTGRVDWRFAKRWRIRGSAQHAWFSDDNQRDIAYASVEVRLPARRPRLRLTYAARWLSYQNDEPQHVDPGYFAPDRFLANLFTGSIGDELFRRKIYYAAEVTGGIQRFRPRPQTFASGSDDTVFGWNALFGVNISRHLAFEASYGRTDYAQQIATGFESRHYGYLLKITF